MEQMLSALLICIPFTLTVIIGFYQFYFLFSNRISKEKFFRDRNRLGIIREIANLIVIAVTLSLGLKEVTIILSILTLNLIGIDIIFLFLGKLNK